jgi:hypothetical protein
MEVIMGKPYIYNGVPWFDQDGDTVNVYLAGISPFIFGWIKTV